MEALEGGFRQTYKQIVDRVMYPDCCEAFPQIAPLLNQLLASIEDIVALHKASIAAAERDKACAAQEVQQAMQMQQEAQVQLFDALQQAENAKYVAEAAVQLLGQAQTTALAAQHVSNVLAGEALQMPAEAFALLSPPTMLQLIPLLKLYCTPAERSYAAEALLRCSTEEAAEAVLPGITICLLAGRTRLQVELLKQLYFQHPSITQQLLEAIQNTPSWSWNAVLRLQRCGAACTNFLDVQELIQLAIHLVQEAAAAAETAETAETNIHFPGQPSAAPAHAPRSAPLLLPSSAMKLALPAPLPPAAACSAPAPAAPVSAAFSTNSLSTTSIHQACSPSEGTTKDSALPLPAAPTPLRSSAGQDITASEEGSLLAASAPATATSYKPQRTNIIQAGASFMPNIPTAATETAEEVQCGADHAARTIPAAACNANPAASAPPAAALRPSDIIWSPASSNNGSSSSSDSCVSASTPVMPKPSPSSSTAPATAEEAVVSGPDDAWTIAAAYQSEPVLGDGLSTPPASSAVLLVGDGIDTDSISHPSNKGAPAALRANNQQSGSRRFGSRFAGACLLGGRKGSAASSSKKVAMEANVLQGEEAACPVSSSAVGAAASNAAACPDDSCLMNDSLALIEVSELYDGKSSSTNSTHLTASPSRSCSHAAVGMPGGLPVLPSMGKLAGRVSSRLKGVWSKVHRRLHSKQCSMEC